MNRKCEECPYWKDNADKAGPFYAKYKCYGKEINCSPQSLPGDN